jgi:hypothetical protein
MSLVHAIVVTSNNDKAIRDAREFALTFFAWRLITPIAGPCWNNWQSFMVAPHGFDESPDHEGFLSEQAKYLETQRDAFKHGIGEFGVHWAEVALGGDDPSCTAGE